MGLKKYSIKTTIPQNIEAEEIFLDAEALRSMEDKGKLEQPIKSRNFIVFYGLALGALLILLGRAGYLQIVEGEYYRNLAEGNRVRIYFSDAPRGVIYDSFGEPLVYNISRFDLAVDLADFLANPVLVQDEILERITVILNPGQSRDKIREFKDGLKRKIIQTKGKTAQLNLIENLDYSAALILESLVYDWPGTRLAQNARRKYVAGEKGEPVFSHILGYTGQADKTDLCGDGADCFYQSSGNFGKSGLEFQYGDLLRGRPGEEQFEVDAFGKTNKHLLSRSAEPGQGLALFIDRGLQIKLYQSLDKMLKQLKLKKAAAVAVNPQNGAVLAMVSLPSFDNNILSQGISQADYNNLIKDISQPLFNRAIAGQYPPGSTIKPLIASAALEEKVISPREKINDQGDLIIINQYNPQIVYRFRDWKVHGLTDIIKAIAESCNIFFYIVGGGYEERTGLGIERIKKYLGLFGLGETTGIDLPYEESGLIPDKDWKEKTKDEKWYIGDTYNAAIGQGDISATPLQMSMAVSAIANGGVLYEPRIVDKIVDSEKNVIKEIQPKAVREKFIRPENLAVVREGMRQTVVSGSARALANLSFKTAGKTGTAQFGSSGKTQAWFIGFAPYENPEIVLTVLVEEGGEGSVAAVPVAKEVLEWWASQKNR